jgi:hypothetical protein
MKKKDNSFLMNVIIKALTVALMLLVLVKLTGVNNKKDDKPKEETETKEEVKQFRKSELILWELFLKEAKQKRYIVEENIESIELIEIIDYGRYLKNLPNIRYEQINFTYKCKSKTICVTDKFHKLTEDSDIRTATTIIDLTNKEYIEMKGYTFKFNDELVPIEGPFVYVGEED